LSLALSIQTAAYKTSIGEMKMSQQQMPMTSGESNLLQALDSIAQRFSVLEARLIAQVSAQRRKRMDRAALSLEVVTIIIVMATAIGLVMRYS
jgi:hypothetical protein